ncbi:MAG: dephospho-CoA kinase [Desulfuromonadaceae bacterium]|nr:dephospho-CoA kinase [Desulfuromonadaceae bacterium]
MRVIGLTGGIASGKSSIARFFEERGVPVIDADQLARIAVMPGSPAVERIAAIFGNEVLAADGSLDRKQLGSMVFASAAKRHQLEEILHPEIRRLSEADIAAAAADGHRLIVYMAPILIEAGATDRVDEIWVVTVRPDIQLERLMRRDGISREEALKMIASQMPLAEKELYGKVVIDNSGTAEQTRRILEDIWERETGNGYE